MNKEIIFTITLLITLLVFAYTSRRLILFFRFTRREPAIRDYAKRWEITLKVAFGQSKIFRRPFIGLMHALVFWGFCVILIGSIEMVIDGLTGIEKSLDFMGGFYSVITASGDVFALLVTLAILIFMARRWVLPISRFEGAEMKKVSHQDASISLLMIGVLMITLLGMNASIVAMGRPSVTYPVGRLLAPMFSSLHLQTLQTWYEIFWWSHILLIFVFANVLPYSKHFHVFMSVPNVFLSRTEPLGKMQHMSYITQEIKRMLDPSLTVDTDAGDVPLARFGVKDVEDVSWKSYFDSLACTECGRCTSVCPAHLTGKKLSPRKIMMDVRARMKEKGPHMIKEGRGYDDHKSLLRDLVTEEELWACTTCNACAQECPVNINHPDLILEMRRYLVMEEASAPGEIKTMFSCIENNGAPWQFSPEDRLLWSDNLTINKN